MYQPIYNSPESSLLTNMDFAKKGDGPNMKLHSIFPYNKGHRQDLMKWRAMTIFDKFVGNYLDWQTSKQ